MAKHHANWKPIKTRNVSGEEYSNPDLPYLISIAYKGALISEILAMPPKTPISFERAGQMAHNEWIRAFKAGRIGHAIGQCRWYEKNFVQWISDQGYHIELTGDEFEIYALSDKVS